MAVETYDLQILLILTIGFALASILGFISQYLKMPVILGYLLAGYMIGPYSPGFVADLKTSEQLAEIGVVLMMFGVGLNFKWKDLFNVKGIAIPGALIQTFVASLLGAFFIYQMNWSLESGIVIGLAIGVASTIVMIRVLSDNQLLHTTEGHIALGWLIVEDMLTVIALILLPTIGLFLNGEEISIFSMINSILAAIIKFILLIVLLLTVGRKLVSYILINVARTRSHELFTLTVLACTFFIATGSSMFFQTSIALGAFIGGMIIGQTVVSHQASAASLPIKDTFAVIFFLSVGMLFNPHAIYDHFLIFAGILCVIVIAKPLIALLIGLALRIPFQTALIVAIALAQIGEFSFILSEEALKLNLLPDEGYDIIVACALVSILLNPLFFAITNRFFLHSGAGNRYPLPRAETTSIANRRSRAIVIGYNFLGQNAVLILEKLGLDLTIIDHNVDIISKLREERKRAVYGDASSSHILESAEIGQAGLVVIAVRKTVTSLNITNLIREVNPKAKILVRIMSMEDRSLFRNLNVKLVCSEQAEEQAFGDGVIELINQLLYSR